MPRSLVGSLLILSSAAALVGTASVVHGRGAEDRRGVPRTSATDSVRVHRGARAAQARFERIRRARLPRTTRSFGGPCVETVGRYCFSGDGDGPDWVPPAEHSAVVAAREDLLAVLESAQFTLPGDGWIAGQRVRYLLEAGRTEEALRAASECLAERWWCRALGGLAHHESGSFEAAESAFSAALAGMPAERSAEWRDLTILLGGSEVRDYGRLAERERAEAENRFWWLADAYYLVPGNDRATEHFARHTRNLIQEQARQVETARWAWDHREILLRFGWPLGWEMTAPASLSSMPGVVSHYPNAAPHLLPPLGSEPLSEALPDEEWPRDERRPRSWYSARYAPRMGALDHQLARFRRGDSVLVVAVLAQPRDSAITDSLLRAEAAEAGLFLSSGPGEPMLRVTRAIQEGSVVLSALVSREPQLVSLEWLHRGARMGVRARYGIPATPDRGGELGLSELLVLEDVDSIPTSLASALELARSSVRLRAGERIGLLWEVYGARSRAERITTALELSGGEPGVIRRLAERARLRRRHAGVALQWDDVLTGAGPHTRTLALELPHRRPGVYDLAVTVSRPGRPPVSVTRKIEVIR